MAKKCVVLYSGGLDSTVMLHMAMKEYGKKNVYPLHIFYYARNSETERNSAITMCEDLDLIYSERFVEPGAFANIPLISKDKKFTNDPSSFVVPFRNHMFLLYAAVLGEQVGAEDIYIGAIKGDYDIFKDCRKSFLDLLAITFAHETGKEFNIITPLIHLTKSEVIEKGFEFGINLDATWSCYTPKGVKGGKPCGKCSACKERNKAFKIYNRGKK